MRENKYFHCWFPPMNVLQDGKPYDGCPVGNIPEFMTLDHIPNRDILKSLSFHFVLIRFVLDGEGTDEEERIIRFSLSTPKEIARGLKRVWESKMGTPYLARIIKDADLALRTLGIVFHSNENEVEEISDRNRQRSTVKGEGESVSWG